MTKQCAICGHGAERGSICTACRAALERARDRTISEFQPLPGLAVATAAGRQVQRSTGRAAPRGERPARGRNDQRGTSGLTDGGLLEVPTRTRASVFVWVIVTLMVLVVTYVAYGVVTRALGAAATMSNNHESALRDGASSSDAPRERGSVAPVVAARSFEAAEPLETIPVPPQPSLEVRSDPAHLDFREHSGTARSLRAERRDAQARRPNTEADPSKSAPAGPPRALQDDADATDGASARTAVTVTTESRARPVEASRPNRWERMATNLKGCARDGLFGGFLCEQRVRLQYCEGYWGQVVQCPGSPANDHGQ